jgi:dichloromethane dehalogenase
MLGQSMPILETWLGRTSHLCGDEISFADLLAFHEFVSHEAGAIIPPEEWAKFPRIRAWFDRLAERSNAKAVSGMIMDVGAMRQAGHMIPMTRKSSLAKGTALTPG